jgi:hypothetical protein
VGVRLDGEPERAEVGEVVLDADRQAAPKALVARLDADRSR